MQTFEPGVTSVAFVEPVQMPYAPATRAVPKPLFPRWMTTILHLLDGFITLVGVNLVVLCALRRMQAGQRMARPIDEGIEVYREAARLLGPFVWVSVLQVLAIAVGAVLLVVPGVLAYVWLYFSQYALIFDGRRGWSALLYSRDLMRGSFFRVALRIVVFLAVLVGLQLVGGRDVLRGQPARRMGGADNGRAVGLDFHGRSACGGRALYDARIPARGGLASVPGHAAWLRPSR